MMATRLVAIALLSAINGKTHWKLGDDLARVKTLASRVRMRRQAQKRGRFAKPSRIPSTARAFGNATEASYRVNHRSG
jgi:hypothetical protein